MKGLNDAVRSSYNPRNFCSVLKNVDGSNINVNEQMDADEFFNNLMDKLETELKRNNQEGIIGRTFGGKLVQEIISSECNHRSTVESDFLTLSIEVKSITSITQSLDRMVAGEILEGENKYSCEECQKKVKARKRESIKKLPNNLIFVLKRFEFKYETYTKSKLNGYCEFPEKIDMSKYSQQYLNEDQLHAIKPEGGYFNFKLRGITIHRGTAESGHYYSIIKDKKGRWLEFNDINVREINFNDIAEIAYGQENESEWSRGVRHGNAYMLFYERESLFDENEGPIASLLDGLKRSSNSMQSYTSERIMSENFEYYLKRVFFDNTYYDFIIDKIKMIGLNQIHLEINQSLMKLAFSTFFMLLLRSKKKDKIPPMYKLLIQLIKQSKEISYWLLVNISTKEFVQEYLIDCLITDMKIFVYGMISESIDRLMVDKEENAIERVNTFIDILLYSIKRDIEEGGQQRNMHHTYIHRLLFDCSKHGPLCQHLREAQLPDFVLHLCGVLAEPPAALPGLPASVEGSAFDGYIRHIDKIIMTLDDISWSKKGESRVKNECSLDYSFAICAFANVVQHTGMGDYLSDLATNKSLLLLLDKCISPASAKSVCGLMLDATNQNFDLFVEMLGDVETKVLGHCAGANVAGVRRYLFFFRCYAYNTEKYETNKKKVDSCNNQNIKILNSIVVLSDKVTIETFDYLLSTLLRMMTNRLFFDKMHKEGQQFLDQLIKRVKAFTQNFIKVSAKNGVTSNANVIRDCEKLALNNQRRRIAQIECVVENKFEELGESILYNSDDEYTVDEQTRQVDVRESANIWKPKHIHQHLGVMIQVSSLGNGGSGANDRVWVRDDNARMAPYNTATAEYMYKIDGV